MAMGSKSTDTPNTDSNDNTYFEKYDLLEELCKGNGEFFKNDDTCKGQRLHGAFMGLIDHIHTAKKLVKQIADFAPEYDFDEHTPGNGYRSFIWVVNASIEHSLKICRKVTHQRTSIVYRKGFYMKEVEACNHLLASLCTCLTYLLILNDWSEKGELFPSGIHSAPELLERGDAINQYCFYGRCLGFQFCDSIRGVLRFISIGMAGFSESYYSDGGFIAKTTTSLWSSGKYYWNPELRARRIVNISQNASVEFCKGFWFLTESELMQKMPSIVGSTVKVNKVIKVPPEPIKIKKISSEDYVDIPIPSSHFGPMPVSARLISSNRRKGMIGELKNQNGILPPSKALIIHSHGGGFVAQSSKSHELYLRDWAVELNTPILSIDYSLAPEAPYPRASEEIFYIYCWALKNCGLLGTLGEIIILAGDSAGANLNTGAVLKCIERGIRKPDGLFIAYCPFLVNFTPSPARLLCLMDPLLPFGFMMRCLKSYACPSPSIIEKNKNIVQKLDEIKNASNNHKLYTWEDASAMPKNDTKILNSISSEENSQLEFLPTEEELLRSPISDTSDTFASASYHSETKENTELLTPDGESSCLSLEEDSQPITQMPIDSIKQNDTTTNTTTTMKSPDNSERYITDFIEKYAIEPSAEAEKVLTPSVPNTLSEENLLYDTGKEIFTVNNIHQQINTVAQNMYTTVTGAMNKLTTTNAVNHKIPKKIPTNFDSLMAKSPSDEFVFEVPRDPYLSPYWASDEILSQLPPCKILSLELDPCLDDCVMLAKKLKRLGVPVGLDIVKGLPHGFLNLTKVSKDANEGSKLCIKRIKELLDMTKL